MPRARHARSRSRSARSESSSSVTKRLRNPRRPRRLRRRSSMPPNWPSVKKKRGARRNSLRVRCRKRVSAPSMRSANWPPRRTRNSRTSTSRASARRPRQPNSRAPSRRSAMPILPRRKRPRHSSGAPRGRGRGRRHQEHDVGAEKGRRQGARAGHGCLARCISPRREPMPSPARRRTRRSPASRKSRAASSPPAGRKNSRRSAR